MHQDILLHYVALFPYEPNISKLRKTPTSRKWYLQEMGTT